MAESAPITPSTARSNKVAWIVLAVVLAVFVYTFGRLATAAWRLYGHGWDLAILNQATWLLAFGKPAYVTTRYIDLWALHLHVLLWPVAAIYRLFPSGLTLLWVQLLCMAATAVPIFLLARDLTRSNAVAVAWAAVFCAYPPMQWMLQHDFHAEPLSVPFFTAALLFAHRRRWVWMGVFLFIAMLSREDAALAVFGLGLGLLLSGERRAGAWTALGGVAYLVLAIKVIMPAFNKPGQEAFYLDLFYHHLGGSMVQVALAPITQPGLVLRCLAEPASLRLLAGLLGPVALLCLFKPSWAAGAAPILYRNMVSAFPATHFIASQYQGFALPFLFAGAVAGGAWVSQRLELSGVRRPVALAVPPVAAALCTFCLPLFEQVWLAPPQAAFAGQVCAPWDVDRQIGELARYRPWAADLDRLIATLPPDASISADTHLLAHVCGRQRAWMFPSPFYVAMHTAADPALITRGNFRAGLRRGEADYILVRPHPADTHPLFDWGWALCMEVLDSDPTYVLERDLGAVRLYRRRRP